jgi:hypothetical protein
MGVAVIEFQPQLEGLDGVTASYGATRRAVEAMIAKWTASERLTVEYQPLAEQLRRLADQMDHPCGRGTPLAMISSEFRQVHAQLMSIPEPASADDELEEFDVVLLEAVEFPDAS